MDQSIGWIHTDFNFRPPTGQIASRTPNIQNAGKHTRIGQLFRRQVKAPKGYVILEGDYSSYHVSMLAFLSGDEKYNRLASLDPHSCYLNSLVMRIRDDKKMLDILHKSGVDLSFIDDDKIHPIDFHKDTDAEILIKAKYLKGDYSSLRTSIAKPTVLGNQILMSAKTLMIQNKKYIKSIKMAESLQAAIRDDYPKQHHYKLALPRYYFDMNQTIAYNAYGRAQRFYDLYYWYTNPQTKERILKMGTSARQLLGFFIQSTSFGHKVDCLRAFCDKTCLVRGKHANDCTCYSRRLNFINDIHDANVCLVKENELEQAGRMLSEMMKYKSKILVSPLYPEGYFCKIEMECGKNWGAVEGKRFKLEDNSDGMRELKLAA